MKPEVKSIISSFIPGLVFVLLLTAIKYYETRYQISFAGFGLFPRSINDLRGIITFPLIHRDYEHLFSNAIPLVILMAMLHYFYKDFSHRVFVLLWVLGGFWLWLGGRPSYHIGASGLVYGLASFLFFSGIWRWDRRMMAVTMIVVFLYGGMIWGIFPFFKETSWEGHLFGGLAGLLLSWVYRKRGPQRVKYHWEDEPEEEDPEIHSMGNFNEEGDHALINQNLNDEISNRENFEDIHSEEFKNDRRINETAKTEEDETGDLFPKEPPVINYRYIASEKDNKKD